MEDSNDADYFENEYDPIQINNDANSTFKDREENWKYQTKLNYVTDEELKSAGLSTSGNRKLSKTTRRNLGEEVLSPLYEKLAQVADEYHLKWFSNVEWLFSQPAAAKTKKSSSSSTSTAPTSTSNTESHENEIESLRNSKVLLYQCQQQLPLPLLQLIYDGYAFNCTKCHQFRAWNQSMDTLHISCEYCFENKEQDKIPTSNTRSKPIPVKEVRETLKNIVKSSNEFQKVKVSLETCYFATVLMILKSKYDWNELQCKEAAASIQKRFAATHSLPFIGGVSKVVHATMLTYLSNKLNRIRAIRPYLESKSFFSDDIAPYIKIMQDFVQDMQWPSQIIEYMIYRAQELYWTVETFSTPLLIVKMVIRECKKFPPACVQHQQLQWDPTIAKKYFHSNQPWPKRYKAFSKRKQQWWKNNTKHL